MICLLLAYDIDRCFFDGLIVEFSAHVDLLDGFLDIVTLDIYIDSVAYSLGHFAAVKVVLPVFVVSVKLCTVSLSVLCKSSGTECTAACATCEGEGH